jgi:transcriptional regulator with XRE-family HTH domain
MKLGELIALSRELKGWSLRDLAQRSDMSSGAISQIETGYIAEPSFRKIVRIAKALGVSLDRLAATE